MIGRRKTGLDIGMNRLYVYAGKRVKTYYTITPDNHRINLGHDLMAAKRALLELDGEQPTCGTIAEHLDDLMKERARLVERGKLSRDTLAGNVTELVPLKKAFGKMQPESVRPKHIWDYLHRYRGVEAPVRANREIALLSRMFARLVNQGALDVNPCIGVERNEEVPRDRLVTEEEFDEFVRFYRGNGHLPEGSAAKKTSDSGVRTALAVQLAYLTGKAQGQILRISRTQITDEGLVFGKRKRGAGTVVTWTPMLKSVVTECLALPTRVTSMYLLCNREGQPYTSSGFRATFQRLMVVWGESGHERFTFHDLRASAVTAVVERGGRASDLTGHRTEAIVSKVYDRRRLRKSPAVR